MGPRKKESAARSNSSCPRNKMTRLQNSEFVKEHFAKKKIFKTQCYTEHTPTDKITEVQKQMGQTEQVTNKVKKGNLM